MDKLYEDMKDKAEKHQSEIDALVSLVEDMATAMRFAGHEVKLVTAGSPPVPVAFVLTVTE